VKELILSDREPLFVGDAKKVYEHPDFSDGYVKILKKNPISFSRYRRLPTYWEFYHEIAEYLVVREKEKESAHFMELITGLVDTDMGVGLVVGAIKDQAGNPAPTVRNIIASKQVTVTQVKAFETFIQWVINTDVIIRELTTTNIVWNYQTESFVLVDGAGCKPFLSLRTISRRYNRKKNKKKANKLRHRARDLRVE